MLAFSASLVHAGVLQVPSGFDGIQKAIDACTNGDLILVSPGVYYENINFKGKAITLCSTNPADPNTVISTVIHAVGRSSAVTFARAEKVSSILMGFTITGGYGSLNPTFSTNVFLGAGVYCYNSSPTITGNIITANAAPNEANLIGYGCGVGCVDSAAHISRNLITGNTGYGGGGILTISGQDSITDNIICSNSALFGGGAVLISGGNLLYNTLVGNAGQVAGQVYASSDPNAVCLVDGNIICNATNGGGFYVQGDDTNTLAAFNDVWNNSGGDYPAGPARTGQNGNISQDPQFVGLDHTDYHLRDVSPCINAGDPNFQPAPGETDFYGDARVYAKRVDIGASEYFDNFRPLADAGPDQLVHVIALPFLIKLDGSASSDPNGAALSYHWRQVGGPDGVFSDPGAASPSFNAPALGTYTFELVVNDATYSSFADTVLVTLKNDPPIANAGDDQIFSDSEPIESITLDGSRSYDPQNAPLSYRWRQTAGWSVQLTDAATARPSFMNPWPGIYRFELVVNNGIQDSKPASVTVAIGPHQPPIADAGPARYVATGSVTLDGTRSYEPDGFGSLSYAWRQISGPIVTMSGTNTAMPLVSGFKANTTVQKAMFELVVSDGYLTSQPSTVTVTVVRTFATNKLTLVNPPFDPAKPTIVAFGGGNCVDGSGMTFGGLWEERANWLTVDTYTTIYTQYGDMLMVYLSGVAPDYRQPIQTIGFSTGNQPAMDVAWYVNTTYNDARYAVNRVSLLDAVCTNPFGRVRQFNSSPVAGEQAWVDNYISNDPNYSPASVVAGTLNVVCRPFRNHGYPVNRYASSSFEYTNGGLTAFAYLSLIGDGRNYQLNTTSNKYYFVVNSSEDIVFFNQTNFPGKILAPVQLTGPADGDTLGSQGVVLGCAAVENAVGYQLLVGPTPDRVMDYTLLSDTTEPPQQLVSTLSQQQIWWTVRAYDQFGSTIYADPRLLQLPANRPPVADAGADQVLYAGLDGNVVVKLDGSRSFDPDGGSLTYTWAWATGTDAHLSNGVSLTIELPVGVHLIQLMVNDGQANSQIAHVNVTVVPPIECTLKLTPSTLNLSSGGQNVLACVGFPDGISAADLQAGEPLVLYPGGLQATRSWNDEGKNDPPNVFAFFDRSAVAAQVQRGQTELTVVGKLRTGQVFYGRDTLRVIGK